MDYEILEDKVEGGIIWPSYVTWPNVDYRIAVDKKGGLHLLYKLPSDRIVHSIYCGCPR